MVETNVSNTSLFLALLLNVVVCHLRLCLTILPRGFIICRPNTAKHQIPVVALHVLSLITFLCK